MQLLWRKTVNNIMLGLTGLCTLLTVSTLFLILGYLLYYGGRSLDWNFFTKLPLSPGESGGGMANAIVGSMEILAMAALIGIPVGFFAGVYLSEFEDKKFASLVRYTADLLNGVPSIIVGILAWTLVVVPMKRFSALAGSIALSVMLIPIVTRQTEQFLAGSAHGSPRGSFGAGGPQVEDDCNRCGASGQQGSPHRNDPRRGTRRR